MDISKLACVFFPDDPAVCPYYAAVINLSCEDNSVSIPQSPSESVNVKVVLGTPYLISLLILL